MNKEEYLDKYIFIGLTDLNDGFDGAAVKYFSQQHFEIVLSRVEKYGLGIPGIEPFINGEFYGVTTYEDYATESTDPKWYKWAFKRYVKSGEKLQYAASYYVPSELLK